MIVFVVYCLKVGIVGDVIVVDYWVFVLFVVHAWLWFKFLFRSARIKGGCDFVWKIFVWKLIREQHC